MIVFPTAKINLGLRVLRRRPDGYHDLSTLMLPVGWCDVLEVVPGAGQGHTLSVGGANVPECDVEQNLVMKAVRALEAYLGRALPPLDFYLEKVIPFGAGLGGGSADASYALIAVNELLGLGIAPATLAAVAARVGADCAFFVMNHYTVLPQLAEGIGDVLSSVEIPALAGMYIAIAKPASAAIPTKEAYAGIRPHELAEGASLAADALRPAAQWQHSELSNDFELSIFPAHPEIAALKAHFLHYGAVYAAMSGSGAAVFGLFNSETEAAEAVAHLSDCQTFAGKL